MPENLPAKQSDDDALSPTAAPTMPSKSYKARRWEYACTEWRRHKEVEIGGSLIATAVGGFAQLLYTGWTLATLFPMLVNSCVSFLVLLIFILIYHFWRAPKALDKQIRSELADLQSELETTQTDARRQLEETRAEGRLELGKVQAELDAERSKNAQPEIKCDIKEVHATRALQTGIPDEEKKIDHYITLKLHIVNAGQKPTTIESFRLTLHTNYGERDAISTPTANLLYKYEQRHTPKFSHASKVEFVYETLTDLERRDDVLLERGNGQKGWLRFVLPEDWDTVGLKIESITLTITDAYGGSHSTSCDRSDWKHTGELVNKHHEELLQNLKDLSIKYPDL